MPTLSTTPPLKVCYFGTYRDEYSRNQIMIAALRAAEVEVIECHVSLWHSIEDRVQAASGNWRSVAFLRRVVTTYLRLLDAYRKLKGNYDVMVLGYPGQIDAFLARLLTWWQRKPLVLDMFMSIYLIASERRLDQTSPLTVRGLRTLEGLACRLPDLLICDTPAYRQWYCRTYGLSPARFHLVPTGADDRVFQPLPLPAAPQAGFRVLYYGTYIPNHSVETIIEAAYRLRHHPEITFELVGDGPTRAAAEALAQRYQLRNVTFIDRVPKTELPAKMAAADVILGAFGTTPQSLMTIQNKIYESLAMGKPIITGISATAAASLTHGRHVYFVDREHPASLAMGILTLKTMPELRRRLASNGQHLFREHYTISRLGQRFRAALHALQHQHQRRT